MIAYRIAKRAWIEDLSGYGAAQFGGRWNSRRNPMLYTSANIALAVLEVFVNTPPGFLPDDYALLILSIPEELPVHDLDIDILPKDWRATPVHVATRAIGDTFLQEEKFAALRVPSAIVPQEKNILLNPEHKQFRKVSVVDIQPFAFDARLFMR